jgi:hypothetical protein
MSETLTGLGLTKPAITDTVAQFVSDTAANVAILDAMWPVGSIYQSTKATNPGTFLGGTWSRIQDRFLVCAGSKWAAGSTGGTDDMGIHKSNQEAAGYGLTKTDGFKDRVIVASENYSGRLVPPYRAVYCWERVA